MKIKLYQNGGNIGFASYVPHETGQVYYSPGYYSIGNIAPQPTQGGGNATLKIDESIYKDLNGKVLPSDMSVIKQYASALNNPQVLRNPVAYNQLRTQYTEVLNNALYAKSQLDEASKSASEKNALNDVAITPSGTVIVKDLISNDIKQVTPEELSYNLEDYRVITNNELINMRANDNALAGEIEISGIVAGAVSKQDVTKYIQNSLKEFGTGSPLLQTYEANTASAIQESARIINKVQTNMHPQGIQKNIEIVSAAILETLPETFKQYLKVQAAINGRDPNNYQSEIGNIIFATVSNQIKHRTAIDTSATKMANAGSGGGSGSGGKSVEFTQGLQVFNQKGTIGITPYHIQEDGKTYTTNLPFIGYGMPTKKDNSSFGKSFLTLEDFLTNSSVGDVLDANSVSFGSTKIPSTDYHKYVIDTNDGMQEVKLPATVNSAGIVTPDFTALTKVAKLTTAIKTYGSPTDITESFLQRLINEYGLSGYVKPSDITIKVGKNSNGKTVISDVNCNWGSLEVGKNAGRFLRVSGFTSEQALKKEIDAKENTGITAFRDKDDKSRISLESAYNSTVPKELQNTQGSWFGSSLFTGDNDMYKAVIYIPISQDQRAAQYAAKTIQQQVGIIPAPNTTTYYNNIEEDTNNSRNTFMEDDDF